MSFVVALFIEAREIVILPENWIKDLNTAKLKNNGCNSNQNFRAYYRIEGLENKDPNFNAPLLTSMKDLRDEGCFLCRIKKFFGNFIIIIQMNFYLLIVYRLILVSIYYYFLLICDYR